MKEVKVYKLKKWVKVLLTIIGFAGCGFIYSQLGYSTNINFELIGWLMIGLISISIIELWND